eukprot:COSAG06_NODE_70106_length_194_cov_13.357895_1_plen_45_part_10
MYRLELPKVVATCLLTVPNVLLIAASIAASIGTRDSEGIFGPHSM